MPAPILLPANLHLLIKRARHRAHDLSVAGQPPQLFALPYQGFVRQRSDEFAVFLRIEFLESDGAEHGSTPGFVECRGRKTILTRC